MKSNKMQRVISSALILVIMITGIVFPPRKTEASEVPGAVEESKAVDESEAAEESGTTEDSETSEESETSGITEIEVNEVKDIYNSSLLSSAKQAVSRGVNVSFSFTIERPAYVNIKTNTTSFLGIAKTTSDLAGKNPVVNYGIVNNGADKYIVTENTTYLEPGIYYIHYSKEDDVLNLVEGGNVAPFIHRASVSAQYISRSVEAGTTLNDATKISTNKTYTGFLSSSVRKQSYTFTLQNRCVVYVEANAEVNTGWEFKDGYMKPYDSALNSANINLYTGKMKKIDNMVAFSADKKTATPIKTVLDPGTYYIEIEGASAMYGYTSIRVNATPTDYLAVPKVTEKKQGTKTIKGTAVPKSKIYVYYNDKAYQTTADAKGDFKLTVASKMVKDSIISVYAVNDNKQSKTLKTKVTQ